MRRSILSADHHNGAVALGLDNRMLEGRTLLAFLSSWLAVLLESNRIPVVRETIVVSVPDLYIDS
jgi:hypothetical protein